jgi:hypothetical protein
MNQGQKPGFKPRCGKLVKRFFFRITRNSFHPNHLPQKKNDTFTMSGPLYLEVERKQRRNTPDALAPGVFLLCLQYFISKPFGMNILGKRYKPKVFVLNILPKTTGGGSQHADSEG